jgi:CubicO group peptidase (beta-lactamase class C family)
MKRDESHFVAPEQQLAASAGSRNAVLAHKLATHAMDRKRNTYPVNLLRRLATSVAAALTSLTLASPAIADDLPATPTPEAQARAEALRLADLWLDSEQAYRHIPALSAAVVQGDETIWAKGYGTVDAAHKVPATSRTIYSICSISKLFTSIALMQQWESGRVRLDDPVTTYLPWAKLRPSGEDSVPITLRAMMSHSAGLPREADFPYWTGPDFPFPTEEQVKAKFAEQAPLWPASRWFQYSNLGLTLVGYTVAAVSGEPYADYAQRHILDPLGLQDTHPYMPMPLYGKRLAVGWGALTREGTRELLKSFDTRGIAPAAGYTSTVEDLGRFAAWQFRLLRTGQAEVLRASTLREMQRVQYTDPDWKSVWGLGFATLRKGNQTYVGHEGSCPGYMSIVALRPSTETAVVVMLTGVEDPVARGAGIFDILDKRKTWDFKPPAAVKGVDLEAYAGRYYAQSWAPETVVVPWAGGLAILQLPSTNPADELVILKPKGDDAFRRIREDGSEADEVRFERDKSGKVIRYVRFSNPVTRVGALPSHPSQ